MSFSRIVQTTKADRVRVQTRTRAPHALEARLCLSSLVFPSSLSFSLFVCYDRSLVKLEGGGWSSGDGGGSGGGGGSGSGGGGGGGDALVSSRSLTFCLCLQVHRARPVDLEFEARRILKSFVSVPQIRGQWDVTMCLGDVPLSPLVSPVRSAGGARPQGLSALPLQRMKWIHTVMGHQRGCLSHIKATKCPGECGCPTPPRQTPPVDQQATLLTTLQTLTSLVQSMAGNQRSQASPTRDTTAPPKEKATTVSFTQVLSMQPSVFTGDGSPDKAEEWIEKVERIFEVLEVPGGNKVNYGSYMLKGDAKRWWKSTREIRFAGQQSISWRQFRDSFFSTYFPAHARNKKMQEFLDLQQNHLSLEEYVTKYQHLETYYPHLYTTAEARADKFVYGLRDGLRVKHQHPTGRARPYERRDDRTFRRNRPGRSETTQGSVASPTSLRCPTCSRVHPGKPCYRVTGACLHCGARLRLSSLVFPSSSSFPLFVCYDRSLVKLEDRGWSSGDGDGGGSGSGGGDALVHRARPVDLEFEARGILKSFVSVPQIRGQWDVTMCLGDVPLSPLVSPVHSAGGARPQVKKKTVVVQAAAAEVVPAASGDIGDGGSVGNLGTCPSPHISELEALEVLTTVIFGCLKIDRRLEVAAGRITAVWTLVLGCTEHIPSTLSSKLEAF
ncbi:hypothetical protein EJ110_NYTH30973 [Nymphaea thermarum]|nr:hypothetical protein EJ110_NYTH30973 [Nymphaea thermarum]